MIYDYECTDCGHIQEEVHKVTENPEIKCERCKMPMKRVITGGTGFALKGDGWYGSGVANRIKKKSTQDQQ
jgi:putative FmdB family regulatory protein